MVSRDGARASRRATGAAVVAACLAVAGAAVLGGAFAPTARTGAEGPRPAAGEPSASFGHTRDDEAISEPSELGEGAAGADDAAADATTAIEPAGDRGPAGAVEAFASYATWVIASPAAAEDPLNTSEALGGALNSADAAMIEAIDHSSDLDFVPSKGAYRVLGHSGDERAPDQVMVELVAPMTVDGRTMWSKIGGVVAWQDGRWLPTSMRPGEVEQPADPSMVLVDMSETERDHLLEGLGWQLFSNADSDG
jgi:hypothetical protein